MGDWNDDQSEYSVNGEGGNLRRGAPRPPLLRSDDDDEEEEREFDEETIDHGEPEEETVPTSRLGLPRVVEMSMIAEEDVNTSRSSLQVGAARKQPPEMNDPTPVPAQRGQFSYDSDGFRDGAALYDELDEAEESCRQRNVVMENDPRFNLSYQVKDKSWEPSPVNHRQRAQPEKSIPPRPEPTSPVARPSSNASRRLNLNSSGSPMPPEEKKKNETKTSSPPEVDDNENKPSGRTARIRFKEGPPDRRTISSAETSDQEGSEGRGGGLVSPTVPLRRTSSPPPKAMASALPRHMTARGDVASDERTPRAYPQSPGATSVAASIFQSTPTRESTHRTRSTFRSEMMENVSAIEGEYGRSSDRLANFRQMPPPPVVSRAAPASQGTLTDSDVIFACQQGGGVQALLTNLDKMRSRNKPQKPTIDFGLIARGPTSKTKEPSVERMNLSSVSSALSTSIAAPGNLTGASHATSRMGDRSTASTATIGRSSTHHASRDRGHHEQRSSTPSLRVESTQNETTMEDMSRPSQSSRQPLGPSTTHNREPVQARWRDPADMYPMEGGDTRRGQVSKPAVVEAAKRSSCSSNQLPPVPSASSTAERSRSSLKSSQRDVNFGYVNEHDSVIMSFKARNGSDEQLRVHVSLGMNSPFFELLDGGEIRVLPGAELTVRIRFTPNERSAYAERLLIKMLNGNGNSFTIPVLGYGGVANVVADPGQPGLSASRSGDYVLRPTSSTGISFRLSNIATRGGYVLIVVLDAAGQRMEGSGIRILPSDRFVIHGGRRKDVSIRLDAVAQTAVERAASRSSTGRASANSSLSSSSSGRDKQERAASTAYTVAVYWGTDSERQRMLRLPEAYKSDILPPSNSCPLTRMDFEHDFADSGRLPTDRASLTSDATNFNASINRFDITVLLRNRNRPLEPPEDDLTDHERTLRPDNTFMAANATMVNVKPDQTVLRR